jgi:hypothetical protein
MVRRGFPFSCTLNHLVAETIDLSNLLTTAFRVKWQEHHQPGHALSHFRESLALEPRHANRCCTGRPHQPRVGEMGPAPRLVPLDIDDPGSTTAEDPEFGSVRLSRLRVIDRYTIAKMMPG